MQEDIKKIREIASTPLTTAGQRFRIYERHHNAKHDPEKASRNKAMAELCEDAMRRIQAIGNHE